MPCIYQSIESYTRRHKCVRVLTVGSVLFIPDPVKMFSLFQSSYRKLWTSQTFWLLCGSEAVPVSGGILVQQCRCQGGWLQCPHHWKLNCCVRALGWWMLLFKSLDRLLKRKDLLQFQNRVSCLSVSHRLLILMLSWCIFNGMYNKMLPCTSINCANLLCIVCVCSSTEHFWQASGADIFFMQTS